MKNKKLILLSSLIATACFAKSIAPETAEAIKSKKIKLDPAEQRIELLTQKPAFGSRVSALTSEQVQGEHKIDQIEDDYIYEPESIPPFIEKALEWLAEAQHEDGTWGAGSSSRQNVRDPHAVQGDPATTAFSAMAFLRSGHTPKKENIKRLSGKQRKPLLKLLKHHPQKDQKLPS